MAAPRARPCLTLLGSTLLAMLPGCHDEAPFDSCAALANVVCTNVAKCCSTEDIYVALDISEERYAEERQDSDWCQAWVRPRCADGAFAGLERTQLTLDCLSALSVGEQCVVRGVRAPWEAACRPNVPEGGGCRDSSVCLEGLECSAAGRCVPIPGQAQGCVSGLGCTLDQYCDQGTCKARLPDGAECANSQVCVGYCAPKTFAQPGTCETTTREFSYCYGQ